MHLFCSGVAPLIGCSVFVPGVFPWAWFATRDCACRRYLRPPGCFLLGVLCGACTVPYVMVPQEWGTQFPTRVSRFEIESLGLQRSWGTAQSWVARIACDCWGMWRVGRTAVFARRPKDGAYHTWGASGLCASGVQPRGEPGRSVCPVKAPRREISGKKEFSKQRSGRRL